MDRLEAMHVFVTVADLRGFAPAARKLHLSPSAVTRLIAALEEHLGARLLQRTTRQVTLTDVGTRYLERARRILADVEEADGSAREERNRPSGRLVVSAPVGFGRLHVGPVMTAYLKRYPEVAGELRLSDHLVNLVEDAVDVAVRIGHLADSSLVARQVGEMRRIVVAAPGYLKRHGEPKTPEALASHQTIQFGPSASWRFMQDGRDIEVTTNPRFTSNSADAALQYAEAGGGRHAGAGLSGRRGLEARAAEGRAGEIRAAGAAHPCRLPDLAPALGQGARVRRSRGGDGGVEVWVKAVIPGLAKREPGISRFRVRCFRIAPE
ncbi:DNA-binding transcriptional LysR family regulator [Bradyrhizobium diazoefficiens]